MNGSAVEYNEITGANAKTPSHGGGSAKAKVPLTHFTSYGSILRSAHAMVMDNSFAHCTTGAVLVFATLAITWSFGGGSSGRRTNSGNTCTR
mmetsp:Transcript_21209/g.31659  ORF Transcript_21209/g.31659 Transcript_21209/m.31659 type:complete len:92 (+) Transcript_21209:1149-1424(+)